MDVGFVGLGAMGFAMASNLATAGHRLTVWNRTASKAEPLVAQGARVAERPGDAATAGGVVVTMVADDAALEAVTLGAGGIAERLGPGGIHLSMSTVAPATARSFARCHAERGSIYVAAPVFGRPDAAKARRLSICVAGPTEAKARVRPLLEAMGQRIFDFGEEPASANVVKIAGNFMIACAIEAMAEAFTLAEKSGVERTRVAEMLGQTFFACPVYQGYGRMVAEKRHTPAGFKLTLGLKDLDLVLRTAAEVTMPMPVASLVRDRFTASVAKGRGEMDWSALALGTLDDAGLGTAG